MVDEGGHKSSAGGSDHLLFSALRIVRSVVAGEVKPETAADQLNVLAKKPRCNASLLLDVFQAIDCEIADREKDKTLFTKLLKNIDQSILPADVLRSTVDSYVSSDEANAQNTRMVKLKTRIFYKQLKFNLLREENEGYSKLITELCQEDLLSAAEALERIRCLIGQFTLDPNRVLDIILECFEYNLQRHDFYTQLLRLYNASSLDLCHLIGFKFTIYQAKYSVKREVPQSLYRLAAVLIHKRLLDLLPLCAYLTPKLEAMLDDLKSRQRAAAEQNRKGQLVSSVAVTELKSASSSADLAAMTAGHASDSPVTGPGTGASAVSSADECQAAEEEEELLLGENQKLGLTWALLDLGDWLHGRQMLDRMPEYYAVANSTRIAGAMIALVNDLIEQFYLQTCPKFKQFFDVPPKVISAASKSARGKQREELAVTVRESTSPLFPSELPAVDSWQSLFDVVLPILHYLGPNVGLSPVLLSRMVKLLTVFVQQRTALTTTGGDTTMFDDLYPKVVDLCDEALLPALTVVSGGNCAMFEEMWTLVGQFPYAVRYRLYGRWKREHTTRHSALLIRKGRIIGKTKYVMKRLSKDTVRTVGRQLGKLSHGHPSVVFDYLLNQIQTFENFIGPVVESVRYLTQLEFDIFTYCIIEHLASPEKQKLKVSDATLSPWLQSLATFVGTLFKKYNMELTGVLQYVANQLKGGKSFDLLVLREVVQNMSGIETASGATVEQIDAMCGGELLRQEGGYFGQVRNIRRATNRLKDALFQEDLVVGLCILMAQQRPSIVHYESQGIHLKLIGQMVDECHDTLMQFSQFVTLNLRPEDYSKRMPPASTLMSEYHLSADVAFLLARPIHAAAINCKYDEAKKADRANKVATTAESKAEHYRAAFEEVVAGLGASMSLVIPTKDCTTRLWVAFWTLTVYDLYVPKEAYARELEKIKRAVLELDDTRESSESRRRKEKDRLAQLENKLSDERRKQEDHVSRVMAVLKTDKEDWFPAGNLQVRSQQVTAFLQSCLLPRARFSDLDALYCCKFILAMHTNKIANFQMLLILDRLLIDMTSLVAGLSENEANYFGRFLNGLLEFVQRWRKDKAIYEKECEGFPGFVTRFRKMDPSGGASETHNSVDFESYRSVTVKWNWRLTRAVVSMMQSGSYVQRRNALIVMIKLLPNFPITERHYSAIEARAKKCEDEDKGKRQDLHILAKSFLGALKMRKLPLIPEDEFGTTKKPAAKPAAKPTTKAAVVATDTAKPTGTTTTVKTTATAVKKPVTKRSAATTAIPTQNGTKAATPTTAAPTSGQKRTSTAAADSKTKSATNSESATPPTKKAKKQSTSQPEADIVIVKKVKKDEGKTAVAPTVETKTTTTTAVAAAATTNATNKPSTVEKPTSTQAPRKIRLAKTEDAARRTTEDVTAAVQQQKAAAEVKRSPTAKEKVPVVAAVKTSASAKPATPSTREAKLISTTSAAAPAHTHRAIEAPASTKAAPNRTVVESASKDHRKSSTIAAADDAHDKLSRRQPVKSSSPSDKVDGSARRSANHDVNNGGKSDAKKPRLSSSRDKEPDGTFSAPNADGGKRRAASKSRRSPSSSERTPDSAHGSSHRRKEKRSSKSKELRKERSSSDVRSNNR